MILATKSGDRRVAQLDGIAALEREAGGGRLTGGSVSSAQALAGLPAANACIRIAATAVGKRPMRVWRGEGIEKTPVRSTWQARLFAGTPDERGTSWLEVFEGTEASLTARNNAYWVKIKDAGGRVVMVELKHPDDVEGRWNRDERRAEYRFRSDDGSLWTDWVDSSVILHFRVGYVQPGCVVAPSPLKLFKDSLEAAVSKRRYERGLYDDGILQSVAVMFPKEVKADQARRFRELLKEEHGGVSNAPKVRVFGGGATVSTIGLSLQDAQFVEGMQFSARELAQILGVPASLIDANDKETRPLTPEHEEDRWNRHWLEARLARIEETLRADRDLFGANARDYPAFTVAPVRGDLAAETARLHQYVQDGILTPDEARAELGYAPHPDGQGAIPQITPVGGAPNPAGTQPAPADPYQEGN